jgi:hypothetical protein
MAEKISASSSDWPVLTGAQALQASQTNSNWKNEAKRATQVFEEKAFKNLLAQQPVGWIYTCLGDVWGRLPPQGYRIVLIVDEEKSHSARTSFKAEYFKE